MRRVVLSVVAVLTLVGCSRQELSESEIFIQKCEELLERIEEMKFLADASVGEYKLRWEGVASDLVERFMGKKCFFRYGDPFEIFPWNPSQVP